MLALLALPLLALATAGADPARLWSTSAVSGRADLLGRTEVRAEQQLAAALDLGGGWTLDGVGALRDPAAVDAPLAGDLLGLHLRQRAGPITLDAGRFALVDARGAQHLDGAAVTRVEDAGELAAWAGRRWHPETWRVGRSWVGGLGAALQPRPGTDLAVGAEVRGAQAGTQGRGWLGLTQRGARGEEGRLLLESASGHRPGARASVAGDLPTRRGRVGAGVRWEGLAQDLLPTALDAPMAWLAPRGYAAAEGRVVRPAGALVLHARGGPVLHRREDGVAPGGLGRAGVTAQPGPLQVGVTAVAAGLETARLTGAVLLAGVRREGASVSADLGAFHLTPSTGPAARVWEGRLRAAAPVPGVRHGAARARAELATGVDRVLDPFVRGGLALDVRLGPAGGGP